MGVRRKCDRTKVYGSDRGDNGTFRFSWEDCEYLEPAKLCTTFESQGVAH